MAVRIVDKLNQFARKSADAMDRSLNRMAVDIERLAKFRVPVSPGGGHLKSSGFHRRKGLMKYVVVFDKEYAAYQEFGGDGKGKVVRKYSTPGTGKHYLRDAGKTVAGNAINYIKQEAQSIRL